MWNLEDTSKYFQLLDTTIPHAYTWGSNGLAKRESIRAAIAVVLPQAIPSAKWWAFRIFAKKQGSRWDIENIPKLIVDAFSHEQIARDGSNYSHVGLYVDDTASHVRLVQIAGEQCSSQDSTRIEIFGGK